MRFPSSALLAGFLVACATGETAGDDVDDLLNQTGGSAGSSNNNTSGGGAGGSGSSSGAGSAAGSFNGGGMPATGGTFVSGGTSFSGTTFTGGNAGAATGGGGATAGGSGGNAGNATAGSAGSGGKAGGGGGGTGGASTGCPAKTAWTATASIHAMDCTDPTSAYCGPPLRAVDGVSDNRYTTGAARTGAEWLQIDFGKEVTVSGLTLRTAAGSTDYTLAYAVRMSNNAADIGSSAVIVSGAGMQGATAVDFPADKKGRYLRINQTMAMAGWWSVAELDVDCQ